MFEKGVVKIRFPRTVYAIKHNVTGKMYVGSSHDFTTRVKGHIYKLKSGKHHNDAMQTDFDKYGCDYSFFELDFIPDFKQKDREYLWMEVLKTRDSETGYNIKDKSRRVCLDDKIVTIEI